MEQPEMILCVNARDFDDEVEEWFMENDYSTHYQNEVVQLWKEDGYDNPFVEWIEKIYDFKFDRSKINNVAVLAT